LTAENLNMYVETFEKVAIGIAHVDVEGRWIHANKQLCDFLGYTHEELLAKTFQEITFKEDIALDLYHANELYQGVQDSFSIEKRYVHKDGTPTWANLTATAVRNEAGAIEYFIAVVEDITNRKISDALLIESQAKFRDFFQKNSSVMLLINPESGKIEDANNAAANYYGYSKQQLIDMPINHINILPAESLTNNLQMAVNENSNYFLFSHRLASGEIREVEAYTSRIKSDNKVLLFSIIYDITERKQAEEKLHLAANVFTHANEGIVITSPDGTIIDVNDAFSRITGYQRDEMIGANPRILNSKLQEKEFYSSMWHDLLEKGQWDGELWNRRKNGEVYAEMLTISSIVDTQGNTQYYVALFSDVTSHKEHEQQLEYIAHYDALTGLPNRVLKSDRLRQAMIHAERRNEKIAVVYLDVDGFKQVNDRYGHSIGDQLLIALSTRMKQALREGDTLSRLGGDEFVAILIDMDDTSTALPVIQRLLDTTSQTIELDDIVVQVSASIGITFYPQHEDVDADQLIRQADQAMYSAKQSGKNRYHIFDPEHDRTIRIQHERLERIQQALDNDEFVLYYQPKVNMRTGELIGAEALIRWQHPEKGLIPPLEFLPIIENHPLSVKIGEWVINKAISQIKQWQTEGLNLLVSVNVGAKQLLQGNFVQRLQWILAQHENFNSSSLKIEVLETSALEDIDLAFNIIEECKAMGIYFALDDFGTGYSSLTYLKRLPVVTLKIDQSFVRDMLEDRDDLAILEGIIGLAKAFGREVIAEGVETHAHGQQLLLLGCELVQGYGIARPMPSEKFIAWSQKWEKTHEWVI